jgi:hypothetical protein
MTEDAETSRDIAMKGAGYYSQATTGARDVINRGSPLIMDAIDRMAPVDDGSVFTMADMGCADGGTSIDMVAKVLKHLRQRLPSRPLQMTYTDLPRNDFSRIFQNVQGLTDLPGYANEIDDLYVFTSATSFHRAMFPANSLNLGFSATSSHYISQIPVNIKNHVHMVGAEGAERAAFKEQGRVDWESILLNRTRELVSGGRLVMFNFGIDEEGRYLGNSGGINMFDTFNNLWAALVEDGSISEDEYLSTNFPQHYRTVEEFTAPVTDQNNPVYKAGLRLEHAETRVVRCPYAMAFENHGDAGKFAREYIPTLRSWSESIFVAGLSETRPLSERQDIIDRFYQSYEDQVASNPEGHGMDYVHAYLVLAKE